MDTTSDDDHPLSPAGRLFLQPLMNQVINCAMAGEHPIPLSSLKTEILNSGMLKHPRFSSLMITSPDGIERWRTTHVDVDRHLIIRRHPLSSVSDDEDAVNDYIADLSLSPLSTDKPLWEIHVLAAHKTVVFRVHHALGDGISLMTMLLSNCRRADDPEATPEMGGGATEARWSWGGVWAVVWFSLVYVLEFALRLVWLRDRTTAVSGGEGVEMWPRRLATARFRLDDMKNVKRLVAGSTINDVLWGVISCGLSKYLDIRSPKALREGDQITGVAMVNLRPHTGSQDLSKLMNGNNSGTRWGNKFGVILLPVHYHRGDSDPLQFVKRAKATVDKKKLSLEAPFSFKLLNLITSVFGAKLSSILNYRILCNTTFTISNIIGPSEKITLTGNPVKYIRVTSSSMPHAITMHMVSYGGVADMQILVAKDIIPDPKVLAKCFQDALSEMNEAAEAVLN